MTMLLLISLATAPIHARPASPAPRQDFAPAAGREKAREEVALLRFRILDGDVPIPGRLTFWRAGAPEAPELFPQADAAPNELALRKNVVYTLTGEGALSVPPGTYRVFASRGIEWSVAETDLSLTAGRSATWDAQLEHEVPTPGWISGDFHLHTLTHSGHGDANMPERIISLVGEGVDFAVATDHNHNTDYGPTIAQLGAGEHLAHVTGNEVSTPIGHFNAFPLSTERAPVDATLRSARELFRLLRAEPNAFGIEPIIQLNHPRWDGIDYFTQTGLDPVTGTSADAAYSEDFDSLEVLNENVGWGYYDPADVDVSTGDNLHSVLEDWFHLLNRGKRYAAVGNSDSHTVHYAFAGYPRNYVECASIDGAVRDVAASVRRRAVFTTTGPILKFEIEGAAMGSDVRAPDGKATLFVEVRAASWIDCDRVKIVVNGDVVETLSTSSGREPVRHNAAHPLAFVRDSWVVLLVEGDDPLRDIVPGGERPVLPLAISNPIWVDADGDGIWTAPYESARTTLREAAGSEELLLESFRSAPSSSREMLLWAAVADGHASLASLVQAGLADPERRPRLAAVRAAELGRVEVALPWLREVWSAAGDPYFAVSTLRALHAAGDDALAARFTELQSRFGAGAVRRYARELAEILPGRFAEDWMVLGYFEASDTGALAGELGPEGAGDGSMSARFAGKDGGEIGWSEAHARSQGYLDLTQISAAAGAENAVAFAQTWLFSESPRSVPCAWGTDDGARLYINGELIYEDAARRAANPLEHLADVALKRGWNRVLFKVENGSGDFGLYFRVLEDSVRSAARPE